MSVKQSTFQMTSVTLRNKDFTMRTIAKDECGIATLKTVTAEYNEVDQLFGLTYFDYYQTFNVSCLIYEIQGTDYNSDGIIEMLMRLKSVFMIQLKGNAPAEILQFADFILQTVAVFHVTDEYCGDVFANGIPTEVSRMENLQTLDLRLKKEYFSAEGLSDIHIKKLYVMTNVEDEDSLTDVIRVLSGEASTMTIETLVTFFNHRIVSDMNLLSFNIQICPEWIKRAELLSQYFGGITSNFKEITTFSKKYVFAFEDLIGFIFKKSAKLEELKFEGILAKQHEDTLSSFVRYIEDNEHLLTDGSVQKLERLLLTSLFGEETYSRMAYLQNNIPKLNVALITTVNDMEFADSDVPKDLCVEPEWETFNQGNAFGCIKYSLAVKDRRKMIRIKSN